MKFVSASAVFVTKVFKVCFFQVEALRLEIQQLRGGGGNLAPRSGPGTGPGYVDPESFFAAAAAGQNPGEQHPDIQVVLPGSTGFKPIGFAN